MTAAYTGPDALGLYQASGFASGDGLGGQLCPSEFCGLAPMVSAAGAGVVRVLAMSQRSDVRRMSLAFTATWLSGTLTVTLCDGTEIKGEAETLSYFEGVLVTAGDGLYWLRVILDPAGLVVDGTVTVRPVILFGGGVGHDDGEDLAGTVTQYGCVFLYAREALTLDSLDIEGGLVTGFAVEELAGELETQTISDRVTAPAGVTWRTGAYAPALSLAAGAAVAVWVRSAMGTATAAGLYRNLVSVGYTVGGEAYGLTLAGGVRVADTSLACYELYGGDHAASAGGELLGSSATLPFEVAVDAPESGTTTWRLRVGRRNKYGLRSLERHLGLTASVDSEGEDAGKPEAPALVSVTDAGGGFAQVRATWTRGAGMAARRWRVTATPDTGAATAYEEEFERADVMGRHTLDMLAGPFAWGANVTVSVSVVWAENRESTADTGSVWLTARTDAVAGAVLGGARMGISGRFGAMLQESWDAATAVARPGSSLMALGDGPVWVVTQMIESSVMTLPLALVDGLTVTDAEGSEAVEVDEGGVLWLCAGGKRACGVDLTAETITAGRFDALTASCPEAGPVFQTAESAWWQVYDAVLGVWVTFLQVDSDGTVRLGTPLTQEV